MVHKLSRRDLLRFAGIAGTAGLAAACQPKIVEVEKVVTQVVKEVVKETVMVAGTPKVVEKEVTKVVEKVVTPTVAPNAYVLLDYWTPGEELGAYKQIVQTFVEQTGIDVAHAYVPLTAGTQASEKLLASIAGGEPPDVAYFDRFLVASWAARDALTDITDLAERDNVNQSDFLTRCWDEAVYCGKLYALATGTDARNLYYNTTHFEEAGLDPANPPKTWAEMDAMHEALTKGDASAGYERLGTIPWYPWLEWMLYIWGMTYEGVDVWDFDNAKCTVNTDPFFEAADWMQTYARKYDIASMNAFGGQFGSGPQDPFGNGLISMMQHGSWMIFTYNQYFPDLQYDVAPMPSKAAATGRNLAGGWSAVGPKGAKHPEEAWKLCDFLTSEAASYLLYRDVPKEVVSYGIPARVKVANDPTIAFSSHPKAKTFIETLNAQYIRPPIPEAQVLFEELGKASDLIAHLKVEPKEALNAVAAKIDEAMAKWSC
jgi:multiple sugar transport system substrate-binding protein